MCLGNNNVSFRAEPSKRGAVEESNVDSQISPRALGRSLVEMTDKETK